MPQMSWDEQAKHALHDIVSIGYDYDGFHKVDDLKGLIDDLVMIAKQAIKGEYRYTNDFWSEIDKYKEAKEMIVEDRGYAFKTKNGSWFLVRCPTCYKENWALAVSSGVCAWCGFDMNKDMVDPELTEEDLYVYDDAKPIKDHK